MVKIVVVLAFVAILAGCSSTRTGSLCTVGPFRPDPGASERWTADEMDQLIVLNESGEKLCGWKP